MPRSIRDSDEDVETRTAIGRRTRTGFGPNITDSPVRRSSRNKQSTKQSGSSPDLSITEINAQGTRTFRTRAGTADSNTLETQKRLRSSKNSVDTEFETLIETQPKKMTRRSIAAATALDTPKANTRPRRMTRAGSETISTPTGRTTRKTRASSMDPEPTIEEPVERLQTDIINTPIRAKRRASVLPSQSTLIEEEEKHFPIIELEKILIETDKKSTNIISTNIKTPNKELELSKSKSNENNSTDKMEGKKDSCSVKGPLDNSESNHMEISETFETKETSSSDENNIPEKDKYSAANINDDILTKDVSTDSPHSFGDTSNKSRSIDENILHVSVEEKEMNSSNKENECLNISNSASEQNKTMSNKKNLHQETSTTVLDTSIKEGKNVESNENIKLDNFSLIESSMSLSDCNNIIKSKNNVNTNEVNCLEEENKSVSMSDTKETPSNEEEHEKTSTSSTTITENLDELNTVPHKVLVNEDDSIPKEQSKINNSSNNQIQDKKIIEEEKNLEIVNQNISNIEEINSKNEIRDKTNASVHPKERLTDISAKEDNCSNDVNTIEIPNVNNDKKKCNATAEVVSTCKDSNAIQDNNSSNGNQDNMSCTSTFESSLPTLEFSDDSIKDSADDAKQTELDSTECLLKLKSPKLSTSIPEKIDSSTVAEFHDIPEADLPDKEEESKIQSSSNTPVMSKTKSVTELNKSKSKEEKKKNDVQNTDEYDDVSDIRMLFQDISADEWKLQNQNANIETRSNSIQSISTVKLETDSETECDLLLVDKKAWLAAEKLKASKDKEKFDYDSDDTVVLKSKLDYLNDKLNNTNKIEIKSKDSAKDNDNSEIKENMEKSLNSSKLSTKETKNEVDEVERSPNKLNDKSKIDVSSHSASKKEKSRRSTSVCNVSRSITVKSLDKQLEEEEVSLSQVFEDQEDKTKVDVINEVEVNTLETKLGRQSSDKKQKKNCSLNSSLNKSDKSKQKSNRRNRLNISSSEEEDNTINSEKNENKSDKSTKGSGKKKYNKNYSTMVHIGSDSDTCDESIDSSNSGIRNKTPRIPRFLFKHKDDEEENEEHNESGDESNEDKFSDRSIDSDINAEYNLDGKTIGKFSDDDIPGDECRASESEFSDPDDNGSDLADFVVDDDEVEEEDEEDEEDEGEDEEEDEDEDEEQEEEKENQEIENEEDKKLIENKNEKKEIEGTEDTVKSYEEKVKDIDGEEINKELQNKSMNVSDIKSNKKKNPKQKVSTEINFSGSDEDEIVSESKVDIISELDSDTSGKKSKKKQKLNENNKTIDETSKKELNESEIILPTKVKGTNISLTCSTPKTDTLQQQQFNKQNISSNEEQENIRLKDLSSANCDTSKSSITNSKNSKKKRSIENNISTDLLELLKDANLPKTLLSKAYLNKTLSPCSETPTTKYLKKQKLNDSAPNIKFEKNKNASEKTDFIDKSDEQSESRTITAETTELLELNSSASAKRKRSAEINVSNDQIESRNKKNKVSSKLDMHTGFGNEKENSENVLNVSDEKKKRKKNKKNKTSKELDTVNVATTVEKKDIEKAEKMEIVTSNKSKKNKKKNKNKKENVESKDKSNGKLMSTTKNDKKSVEIENIPNKKKKITSELSTLHVKEQLKKSQRKNILKSSTMSDAKVSNETSRENIEFLKSKHEALEAAKRAAESIKANRDMEKNKQRKQLEKIQQEKDIKVKKSDQIMTKTFSRGIKRLPPDVIENLSDVPMNPFKKTKLFKSPMQQMVRAPSTSITKNGFTECGIAKAKKNYNPSNSGGTTEFDVINLQKEKKQSKKTSTVVSFRNKMLSRNSRYPVTSYIMYLQKQKVSNKDQCFAKQF